MGEQNDRELEDELYQRLLGVQLVCEADLPDALVDAAEVVVRPHLGAQRHALLSDRHPATLVTYFVRRGAAVYTRNELWAPLGVTAHQKEAGEAFLRALRRLGLPDFADQIERAGARRFVAPILIHGAFPASVARRLVECLEDELRRGLVDGSEARQRLLRRSDVEQMLRRPATRLLTWCPAYAEGLLDAVIEHIDRPDGDALQRLPVHLRTALGQDIERRRSLRRLRVPRVEFTFWSGMGPQIGGIDGANWLLASGTHTEPLRASDLVELSPRQAATALGMGRSLAVWPDSEAHFFDLDGRLVAPDAPVPSSCIVLLPESWRLWGNDGQPLDEGDEGALLSGPWSQYRSFVVRLAGHEQVLIGSNVEAAIRRPVAGGQAPQLFGSVVEGVCGPLGEPIFNTMPSMSTTGSLTAQFTSPSIRLRSVSLEGASTHPLDELLPEGPVVGDIILLGSTTVTMRVHVVPGLEVERPANVLGPTDIAQVRYRTDTGEGKIDVPPHASTVSLPIPGVPVGTVVVPLPRVQWSIRTRRSTRLDFADGVVRMTPEEMLAEPLWLLVRTGVPMQIGLSLFIDGREHQVLPARPTSCTTNTTHHRSIALDVLSDSVRAHRNAHLELRLFADGERITVIECGERPVQADERRWSTPSSTLRPTPNTAVLNEVDWLRAARPRSEYDVVNDAFFASLAQADTGDAVVTFLRSLGQAQETWRATEFPIGQSANDWARFEGVADSLWRLTGVRHREFSGPQRERLRQWAGRRREQCRRAPEQERRDIEQWLVRNYPPLADLVEWDNRDLVHDALPNRGDVTSEWLPATVLFHVLSLVGGDHASSLQVEEAVTLSPQLTLEATAFVMQFLHNGGRVIPPVFPDDDEDEDEAADDHEDVPAPPPVLVSLDDCELIVDGRSIVLSARTVCSAPSLRLIAGSRATAVVNGTLREDGVFGFAVPSDLRGSIGVELVDSRSVPNDCAVSRTLSVGTPPMSKGSRQTRLHDLGSLADGRLDGLARHIAAGAAGGAHARAAVEELFEEERAGAAALLRLRDGGQQRDFDLALIACLPAAFLVSSLGVAPQQVSDHRLAYAMFGPRHAAGWTALGWPNARTFYSASTWTDLAGFVQRLAPTDRFMTPTFRYCSDAGPRSPRRVGHLVTHLEEKGVDSTYLDIVVATHRLITVDQLADESMRLLLSSYLLHARATKEAIIAGIAVTLACES